MSLRFPLTEATIESLRLTLNRSRPCERQVQGGHFSTLGDGSWPGVILNDRNLTDRAAVQLSCRHLYQVVNPIRPAAAELLRAQGLLAELAAACRKEHVLRRRWMPPPLNRRPLKNN
jgi:hypothetical protein